MLSFPPPHPKNRNPPSFYIKLCCSSSLENSSSPSVIWLDLLDFLISSAPLLLSYIGSIPLSYYFFLFFLAISRLVSSSSELLSSDSSSSSDSSDSCSSLNSLERFSNSFSVVFYCSTSGGACFLRAEGSSWSKISDSDSCSDSVGRGWGSGNFLLDFFDLVSSSGVGVGVGKVEVKLRTGPPTSMAPDFIFSF